MEAKPSVVENMAPVLSRAFSPLTVLLLADILSALVAQATLADADRDLLVVTTLVLVLVLGPWLCDVSARDPGTPAGRLFDWVLFALLIGALPVDAVVPAAMLSRIAEFRATAKNVAALGLNVVILAIPPVFGFA